MIPFDQIDQRLADIGKNRAWLAETTGRSPDSIRVALAPKASKTKRSALLQKALSDAIEREENNIPAKFITPPPPDSITLIPTDEQYRAWSAAQKISPHETLKDWAIESLDEAAKQWAGLKVADDTTPYRHTPRTGEMGNG